MATTTEDMHTLYSQTFLDNYLVRPSAFDMGYEVLTMQGCIKTRKPTAKTPRFLLSTTT